MARSENLSADDADNVIASEPAPTRKISITFERKKDLGNYENVVGRAWVEHNVPDDASAHDVSVALADLFLAAKSAVLDELGIEYEIGADAIIREKVVAVTRTSTPAAAAPRAPQGGSDNGSSGDIRVMNSAEASSDPLPGWLVSECSKLGITAVWDRRLTCTGNQPQFQEAVARGTTGHAKDGKAKGFWPPK